MISLAGFIFGTFLFIIELLVFRSSHSIKNSFLTNILKECKAKINIRASKKEEEKKWKVLLKIIIKAL